ncbi:MAG: septal ring lytic transglycosylase RlpA family protein [Novosphingobium sp.]|nr:septal ring lytic transglycosylase RlpA family protein [Novosphingobium sp.]
MRANTAIRASAGKTPDHGAAPLAIRSRIAGRIAPAAAAALLLGAAGASVPGSTAQAEIQAPPANAPASPLVPAPVQSTGFDQAFAAYATVPAASPLTDSTPDASADGPRFEDPGTPIAGGTASYYGNQFAGHRTASGERFDPAGFTAAHRSLPFGSKVRVTNARTGASVVVTINDRGPFSRNRVIDVSQAAARQLGLIGPGSGKVSLAVLGS